MSEESLHRINQILYLSGGWSERKSNWNKRIRISRLIQSECFSPAFFLNLYFIKCDIFGKL